MLGAPQRRVLRSVAILLMFTDNLGTACSSSLERMIEQLVYYARLRTEPKTDLPGRFWGEDSQFSARATLLGT